MWWPWKQDDDIDEPAESERCICALANRITKTEEAVAQLDALSARIVALEQKWTHLVGALCGSVPPQQPPPIEPTRDTMRRLHKQLFDDKGQ